MESFLKMNEQKKIPGKTNKTILFAVTDGKTIPIKEVPDPVFSEKMIGDGFAMIPSSDTVLAPATGRLYQVADGFHAFSLLTKNGTEILIHIGLDTVTLNGKGFNSSLKKGMIVHKGDPLVTFDRNYLLSKNRGLFIPVVVINGCNENYHYDFHQTDDAVAGETLAMSVIETVL